MNAPAVQIHPSGSSTALEEAFRKDPSGFNMFVQGVTACVVQSMKGPDALPEPSATLDKVFEVYRRSATIKGRSVQNNILALLRLLELATGRRADPAQVPLSEINKKLLFEAQERMFQVYTAGMTEGPEKQKATEQALRTSRRYICLARSIFSGSGIDFLSRYEAAGILVPHCVGGFLKAKIRGRARKVYPSVPPEAVLRALAKIGEKRLSDLPTYLGFWLAIGAALRRGEIMQCRWEHLIEEKGGDIRVYGEDLIGKDGLPINIRLQKRAAVALMPFVKAMRSDGALKVVDRAFHRRLNKFLREMGFVNTRLAMHELRCWIGSKMYEVSPRAAKELLRHKNLQTTEAHYCKYVKAAELPEVL